MKMLHSNPLFQTWIVTYIIVISWKSCAFTSFAVNPYAHSYIETYRNMEPKGIPYSTRRHAYPLLGYNILTASEYSKEGVFFDKENEKYGTHSEVFDANYHTQESSGYMEYPMADSARILIGHNPYMVPGYNYLQQQPSYQNDPFGYADMDFKKTYPSFGYNDEDYGDKYNEYRHRNDNGLHIPKRKLKQYSKRQKKRKVYFPVVIKKKKKKKRKTLAVYKGFYIPGGMQIFGKFKKIKDCKKACEITPNCFSADYNPWLKKCYIHTNVSACNTMRTHPKLIHFKKVPCDLLETPRGLIILGARIHGGLEQKGIKNLQNCIKKCATAGQGIAPTTTDIAKQICFGVDYDFATHKCYFHTDSTLCPPVIPVPTPPQTVQAPSNVLILLCPMTPT